MLFTCNQVWLQFMLDKPTTSELGMRRDRKASNKNSSTLFLRARCRLGRNLVEMKAAHAQLCWCIQSFWCSWIRFDLHLTKRGLGGRSTLRRNMDVYAGHKHFKLICSASKTIQVQVWSAHSHKWPKPKLSPQALADINASNCCIRMYKTLSATHFVYSCAGCFYEYLSFWSFLVTHESLWTSQN